MTGFILAAGFGTRLKPITDTVPKALVPVCGEPLLAHNLRTLRKSGIFTAIGVNSHYLHERMREFQRESPIPFQMFHEADKIRGTGGALYFARDFLARDEAFMIANVDILHKFNLARLSARFMKEERICSLVSIPVESGGTILYDGMSCNFLGVSSDREAIYKDCNLQPVTPDITAYPNITAFSDITGIPNPTVVPSEANFTGIAFYRRNFLNFVRADDFSIIPIWKRVIESGRPLGVLIPSKSASWWMDIGTHEALRKVEEDAANGVVSLSD